MYEKTEETLKPTEKIDIFYKLINGEKISPVLDKFETRSVIGMQRFLWDIAAEFGVISRGKNFSRKEITRKMTSTSKFQQQQACNEKAFNCKGTQCIYTKPDCARQKIKEQVDVLADVVKEYIRIEQKREYFE